LKARCGYCHEEYMVCQCCNEVEDKPKYKENTNKKYVHEKWSIEKLKEELEKINKKYQILKLILIAQIGFYFIQRGIK